MPEYNDLTPAQQRAVDNWGATNTDYFDNADNYRMAVVGNAAHEAAYDDAQRNGCCGSYDTTLQCDDGTELMYGFNYGH